MCENGHFRGFRSHAEFRPGGTFAGCFTRETLDRDADAVAARVEPSPRRRTEVLEDATRCALCGTPPAQHPMHDDGAVRTDREVWTWLQRWRPDVFADVVAALAVARARGDVAASWRLAMPAPVRERVVDALRASTLTSDQVVPPVRLAPIAKALSKRERDFAVNGLLIAACARCAATRWAQHHDARAFLQAYVQAMYDGDEARARTDTSRWRMMEKVAAAAAHASAHAVVRSA